MSPTEVLARISHALQRAGIDFMLTGSLASAYYGSPRSTQDIDIVIAATPDQIRTLVNLLSSGDYYLDLEAALQAQVRRSQFHIIDVVTGWKIDLIFRKERAFSQQEFQRRTEVQVEDLRVFVATAEDVVVAKLEWAKLGASLRQIEDAAGIVRMQADTLDREYVVKWVRELGLDDEWARAVRAAGI